MIAMKYKNVALETLPTSSEILTPIAMEVSYVWYSRFGVSGTQYYLFRCISLHTFPPVYRTLRWVSVILAPILLFILSYKPSIEQHFLLCTPLLQGEGAVVQKISQILRSLRALYVE